VIGGKHSASQALGISRVEVPALLARSDILSLHAPLTPATQGLIGQRDIAASKRVRHRRSLFPSGLH
jgi:phosphoglycerate dehydrogenase-like enzyme